VTRGRLFSATSSDDLEQIYADIGTTVSTVREPHEITVFFVAAAAALLLAAAGLSILWFRRLP
jgi:Ca-activated chloride channel family protein